jgi:hypothetical protein
MLVCQSVYVKWRTSIQTSDQRIKKITTDNTLLDSFYETTRYTHQLDYDFVFDPKNKYLTENGLTAVIDVSKDASPSQWYLIMFFQLEFRKIYSQLTNEALDDMAKFFDSDIYSDITIVASDGKEIRAHRSIIATRSPVFERKHLSQMLESRTNQILVDDIDHQTMYEVLRYLYTRKVQNVETLASNLMYAAEKYDIADLKSLCASAMISQLSINNALKTLVLADRYNEEQLLTETMEFIDRYVSL